MAILQIPTRNDLAAYSERVELDGNVFTLSFRWNDRMSRWICDFASAEGEPSLIGLPLVADYAFNRQFAGRNREGVPEGLMATLDKTGEAADPNLDNLGKEVIVIYQEP